MMRMIGLILLFTVAGAQALADVSVIERFGIEKRSAPASSQVQSLVELFRSKLADQESENAFLVVETVAVTRDFELFVSSRQLLSLLNGAIDSDNFRLDLERTKHPFQPVPGALVLEQFEMVTCTDHLGADRAARRLMPPEEYVDLDSSDVKELQSSLSFLATDCDLSTALVRLSYNDAVVDALVFADKQSQRVTLIGMGANP